ncbi:MAG: alpha-amylase family protein [Bacteroidota bacterium]
MNATSSNVSITFDERRPLTGVHLVDRLSERELCAGGEMEIFLRFPNRLSDPVYLRQIVSADSSDGQISMVVTDDSGLHHATIAVRESEQGLRFGLEVEAAEAIWMAEWKLGGFILDEIIVPALGGQVITRDMPSERPLAYKYPFWWNAQFAIGTHDDGGVFLRTMEVHPALKVLRITKSDGHPDSFGLGLAFEADAPIESRTLAAEFFIDAFRGDWREPVARHRAWLEEAFNLVPFGAHPHFPAWAADIDFILEIWGMSKHRARPAHTFDEIIDRIEDFAAMHDASKTMLYLPGYAEGGIDANAPGYEPAPKCGGREAFGRLVDRAHALGYRVMIHTNVLAMTFSHERFGEFERYQVVDPFGRKQTWGIDMDGDWLAEPYFAYINPGYDAWGDLMEKTLGELIETFELDAVFLDQTLLAFNDSRGPNFMLGMRKHIERLQKAYADVLFAGEGLHEQVLPALPVAQIHGLDSIADVHGMEGTEAWRRVHPVSVELFSRYTRFMAHLLTRHPSSASFERQEAAYAELGVIPALVLYDRAQELDEAAVRRMAERVQTARTPYEP